MFKLGGDIWIKAVLPHLTKISDLRNYTAMIKNVHGFVPEAIILDYADEIAPEENSLKADLHAAGRDVYGNFVAWLKEDQLVGWTGLQSGRGAGEELVADQHHTGGSIAKAQIADLIISINRTREEEEKGLTRLFVAKAREAKARYSVCIQSDFSKMAFWTRGE